MPQMTANVNSIANQSSLRKSGAMRMGAGGGALAGAALLVFGLLLTLSLSMINPDQLVLPGKKEPTLKAEPLRFVHSKVAGKRLLATLLMVEFELLTSSAA